MPGELEDAAKELDGIYDKLANGALIGTADLVRLRDLAAAIREVSREHHAQINHAQHTVYRCSLAWAELDRATKAAAAIMQGGPESIAT